jgi:hypothetical protein
LDDLAAMYIDDEWWEDISDADSREAIMRDIAAATEADDAAEAAGGGEGDAPVELEGDEQEPMAALDWMPEAAAAAGGGGDAAGIDAAAGDLNPAVFAPAAGILGPAAAAGAGAAAGFLAPLPAAAAAAGGGAGAGLRRRRFKPPELQAELRRDMPNTSVFISILRG